MRKAFVEKLTELAEQDKDVMLLTGDLGFSVFEDFMKRFPKQYLNVGLCEQSMIGMASGLAMEGKKVYAYSIIPFLVARAFEQIRNDLCYQQVPVKLVGVGSGMVYGGLGGTHHGIDDVAVMTSLPEMKVFSPGDPEEVLSIVEQSKDFGSPCYIRLNRAGDPTFHSKVSIKSLRIGEPLKLRGEGSDVVIFTVGSMLALGTEVLNDLEKGGVKGELYSVHTLKPVNCKAIAKIMKGKKLVVVLEELVATNGFSSTISKIIVKHGTGNKVKFFSLPNEFSHKVGSQKFLEEEYGLEKNNVVKQIQSVLS